MQKKQVIVYYGDGEGKTSAALGHALRNSAYDKTAIVFFMKGRETGEVKSLKNIKNIKFFLTGLKKFLTERTRMSHFRKARLALEIAEKITKSGYSLVVLDEILYAVQFGMLSESELLSLVKNSKASLILTGGKPTKKLLNLSTIATEFKKVRHHYETDKKTIKGIDF